MNDFEPGSNGGELEAESGPMSGKPLTSTNHFSMLLLDKSDNIRQLILATTSSHQNRSIAAAAILETTFHCHALPETESEEGKEYKNHNRDHYS